MPIHTKGLNDSIEPCNFAFNNNPIYIAPKKQIKDKKPEQTIFAMVAPKDTDKLYGIADLGIHAFELTPEQFDQALQTIAQLNPYEME